MKYTKPGAPGLFFVRAIEVDDPEPTGHGLIDPEGSRLPRGQAGGRHSRAAPRGLIIPPMSVSPKTDPFIQEAWDQAVASSGLHAAGVHLLPVPGAAVQGTNKAACYPRDKVLVDDPDDLLHGPMLAEANLPQIRPMHRIAIYEDVDEDDPVAIAILAATLRHELRHAEQHETCGEALRPLDELADCVVSWKVGGLSGSGLLYNFKPTELDANGASAMFLRRHYPDEVEVILEGEDSALARSNTPPGSLLDLPAKTVAFLFSFREVAEDPARTPSGLGFRQRLGYIQPQWAELWDSMVASVDAVET